MASETTANRLQAAPYTGRGPSAIVHRMSQQTPPAPPVRAKRGPRTRKPQSGPYPNRIGDVRTARGLTQAQVVDATGMSASYLKQLEGGTRPITANVLIQLCKVLKCAPEELCVTDPDPETAEMLLVAMLRMMPEAERALLIESAKRFLRVP